MSSRKFKFKVKFLCMKERLTENLQLHSNTEESNEKALSHKAFWVSRIPSQNTTGTRILQFASDLWNQGGFPGHDLTPEVKSDKLNDLEG